MAGHSGSVRAVRCISHAINGAVIQLPVQCVWLLSRGHATSARDDEGADASGRAQNGHAGSFNADHDSARTQAASHLKAALRALYKRVHPDLFSGNASAQVQGLSENERSFKLLQEYLELARNPNRDSPAAHVPYRFSFFLRDGEDVPQGGHPPSSPSPATPLGMQRVDVTLPPPAAPTGWQAASSAARGQVLAASVRTGLGRLFRACGVEVGAGFEEQEHQGPGAGLGGEGGSGPASLAEFLPPAMEAQRQAQAAGLEPGVRVANLRGALRLQRKVLVSFQDPSSVPPAQQVTLITQLAGLLDRLPDLELQGCHIQLGSSLGIDKQGFLCLDIRPGSGGPDAWQTLLAGVDMGFVRERRAAMARLRDLELRLAVALGLHSLFSALPAAAAEPPYRAFLERLADAANTLGQVGRGFQELPLCVMTAYAFHLQQQQQQQDGHQQQEGGQQQGLRGSHGVAQCRVDSTLGVLCVPDTLDAPGVYAAVRQRGPVAVQCLRDIRQRKQEQAALVARMKTALRLRRFAKDDRLSDADFKAACGQLLEQSDALAHVTDGGAVRLGFVNRVLPDGSFVEIAHNFKL